MKKLLAYREAYLRNEDGATAIEYGLIAAGISLAIVAVVFTFGEQLNELFTTMGDRLTTANENAAAAEDPAP
ncbi:MAG: Flp family type IVb pilin [Alphaproteobacteria bacterium]